MCCIVRTNPELHYAPFLIDLFAHLLLYMSVGEAYDVVQCMLRASRHNHTFFPVTLKYVTLSSAIHLIALTCTTIL
jgi:hypothetical protein